MKNFLLQNVGAVRWHEKQRGFTLIEVIVATSLFIIVMTVSAAALLTVVNANYKSQTLKNVSDNLNFALEDMARRVRVGTGYDCDPLSSAVYDCEWGTGGAQSFTFIAQGGSTMKYYLAPNPQDATKKQVFQDITISGNTTSYPVTAPEINVEDLRFYVNGANPTYDPGTGAPTGDTDHPRTLILLRATTAGKDGTQSTFRVQTSVSMRGID